MAIDNSLHNNERAPASSKGVALTAVFILIIVSILSILGSGFSNLTSVVNTSYSIPLAIIAFLFQFALFIAIARDDARLASPLILGEIVLVLLNIIAIIIMWSYWTNRQQVENSSWAYIVIGIVIEAILIVPLVFHRKHLVDNEGYYFNNNNNNSYYNNNNKGFDRGGNDLRSGGGSAIVNPNVSTVNSNSNIGATPVAYV